MLKYLLKAKPVLHGLGILISAVISGITALQLGGDPVVGVGIGAAANALVAAAS